MICPKCNTKMSIGQAIDYPNESAKNVCTMFGVYRLKVKNLELIDCYKCPECGHSEDII